MNTPLQSWSVSGTGFVDPAFHKHLSNRRGELFGDYELIIDRCLNGDPEVKRKVTQADLDGRRGLSVLKYALSRSKVSLPSDLKRIMATCELDQEFYDEHVKSDMTNIYKHRGRFRLRMTVCGRRKSMLFDTLQDAQSCRDRLTLLLEVEEDRKSTECDFVSC